MQGSPLEKNHTTVLAVAQAWSKSALLAPQPYPPMGSIFWVSIPLRLTRCSWVYVLGGGC